MSFIKKAIKKVFKVVKRVVKSDIFKWVAIAALVFFTAGVAAGGFAAFTGVNGIGAFFTAVGQTMATGAASIASSLGFQGVSSSLASHGGAAAIQAGLTTSATSATGAALAADAATGTISATQAGGATGVLAQRGGEAVVLSSKGMAAAQAAAAQAAQTAGTATVGTGTVFEGGYAAGGIEATSTGTNLELVTNALIKEAPAGLSNGTKTVLLTGLMTGAQSALASRASKNKKLGPTFVAGGLSRGGGTDVSVPVVTFGRKPTAVDTAASQDTYIAEQSAPSVAGQMARQESPAGPMQANQAVLDPRQPQELPAYRGEMETAVADAAPPEARDGLGVLQQARQPQFQNTNSFFANLPQATPQATAQPSGSFEDRIFGGSILGVG